MPIDRERWREHEVKVFGHLLVACHQVIIGVALDATECLDCGFGRLHCLRLRAVNNVKLMLIQAEALGLVGPDSCAGLEARGETCAPAGPGVRPDAEIGPSACVAGIRLGLLERGRQLFCDLGIAALAVMDLTEIVPRNVFSISFQIQNEIAGYIVLIGAPEFDGHRDECVHTCSAVGDLG
jgi:hypothetical protein